MSRQVELSGRTSSSASWRLAHVTCRMLSAGRDASARWLQAALACIARQRETRDLITVVFTAQYTC